MLFGKSGRSREVPSKLKRKEDRELASSGTDEEERIAAHMLRHAHELLSEWYSYLSSKAIYADQWHEVDWWQRRVPRDLSLLCETMSQDNWWARPLSLRDVCQSIWSVHQRALTVDECPETFRLAELSCKLEEMISDE